MPKLSEIMAAPSAVPRRVKLSELEMPITDTPVTTVYPEGSPEDNARRLAQGGNTFQEQSAIADQSAANYQSQVDALNQQEGWGRTLALGGRAMLSGLAAIPDLVAAPASNLLNRVLPDNFQTSSIGSAINTGLDMAGVPRPENAAERVGSNITSAITGAAVPVGLGNTLATTAGNQVAKGVGRNLATAPGAQLASAVTGSTASELTREGGGSQGAQLAAGLAGALAPATLAVAPSAAAAGAMRASVPEVRKEVARMAAEKGITLTPAQLSDSRFMKFAQSSLRSVPFTGAQGRFAEQVTDFNKALARTIGETADNVSPEVYAAAKIRQGELFDALTERNALKVDDQLIKSLGNIAENSKISPAIAQEVEGAIDSLYARATTGPEGVVIPGAAYQAFDSELNNIIKSGGSSAHFLGNVQTAVRRAMDKSISPADRDAWSKLRTEYGNRKTLTPLVAKSESGQLSPPQIMGAATANKSAKEAMASGRRGDMGDMARIGQLMKEPASSGTMERLGVGGLLTGWTALDPVTGLLTFSAANAISRGLDSKKLAALMIKENPSLTMDAAEEIISRSVGPAAAATQQERK